MGSGFISNHFVDERGNPAGGTTFGVGFTIGWQHGPLGRNEFRKEANGAFVEDVIAAVIDRLEFSSADNKSAVAYLRQALLSLELKTVRREALGID